MRIFEDVMEQGIDLKPVFLDGIQWMIPDYLCVKDTECIILDSKLQPDKLSPYTAYIYNENLYLTDEKGNIAYINCLIKKTRDTYKIRREHPEYKSVGGAKALNSDMDAGHFGLALGQHPSIAMEQNKVMNRYGVWRVFERYLYDLSETESVHLIGVFVEGDDEGTYSPFWCIREESNGEYYEYIFSNDAEQS